MGPDFVLGNDTEAIMAQCPKDMAEERFCLCLMTFLETGLLKSRSGSIFGASCCDIGGKADLENTKLMKSLRNQ